MKIYHNLLIGEAFETYKNHILAEAAEKIRNTPLPENTWDYAHFRDQGADWAADLIDPKVDK